MLACSFILESSSKLLVFVTRVSFSDSNYILYAKNLAPPFLTIFFWIKIDDFKNQCSLVFMPVQNTIVVEKKYSVYEIIPTFV